MSKSKPTDAERVDAYVRESCRAILDEHGGSLDAVQAFIESLRRMPNAGTAEEAANVRRRLAAVMDAVGTTSVDTVTGTGRTTGLHNLAARIRQTVTDARARVDKENADAAAQAKAAEDARQAAIAAKEARRVEFERLKALRAEFGE